MWYMVCLIALLIVVLPAFALQFWIDPNAALDMQGYLQVAETIREPLTFVTYYQPLYPFILSLAGPHLLMASQPWFWALGILCVGGLVYRATGSPFHGAAAMFLLALDLRLLLQSYVLMTEALTIAMLSVILWALHRVWQDQHWGFAILGAVALFLLALLRGGYIWFSLAILLVLFAAQVRAARRSYLALGIAGVLALSIIAKLTISQIVLGVPVGNLGINLVRVLGTNRDLMLSLPEDDPIRRVWAANGNLQVLIRSSDWDRLNRVVPGSYRRAALANPLGLGRGGLRTIAAVEASRSYGLSLDDPAVATVERERWATPYRMVTSLIMRSRREFRLLWIALLALPLVLVTRDRAARRAYVLLWFVVAYSTAAIAFGFVPYLWGDTGRMAVAVEPFLVAMAAMMLQGRGPRRRAPVGPGDGCDEPGTVRGEQQQLGEAGDEGARRLEGQRDR